MILRYTLPEMAALWSEEAKFDSWLKVEKAVAEVQGRLGIIPKSAARAIQRASFNLGEIAKFEAEMNHDVLAFVRSVSQSIGAPGRYVHYGLTSYDVVDTALALRTVEALDLITRSLHELKAECARLALEYKNTPMIGRTHGLHAEPITFGLKVLSWYSEMGRCIENATLARAAVAYGKISGAVGSYTQLPVKLETEVLKQLNLKPEPVSTQVVPRDRHARMLSMLALIASSLERIATEIRNLQRTEIDEVSEPFRRGQRGSSAMPHKKNPIHCERIVSLARVIRSYAIVGMENIPLWHERDLTNSAAERIIIPESCSYLYYIIHLMNRVLKGLVVRPERMQENLEKSRGVFFTQALMLALVKAGMDRDRAYKLVQSLAFQAQTEARDLAELCRSHPEIKETLSSRQLERVFDIRRLLSQVARVYQRCGLTRPPDSPDAPAG